MSANTQSASETVPLSQAYALAVDAVQRGNLTRAEHILGQLLKARPAHAESLHLLGVCQQRRGDRTSAERSIRAALALDRNHPVFHFNLATVLHESGRLEEALGCHELALQLDPNLTEARNGLANTLFALGRHDEALRGYDEVLRRSPDHVPAHYNKGLLLQALRHFDPAKQCFDQVVALAPGSPEGYAARGALSQAMGNLAQALEDFRQALHLNPKQVNALYGKALIDMGRNDLQEAAEGFYQVVTENPAHALAYYNLAFTFVLQEKWEGALAAFAKTIEHDRGIPFAYGYWLYVRMHLCIWADLGKDCQDLLALIDQGRLVCAPFPLLALPASAAQQKKCAELYVQAKYPSATQAVRRSRSTKEKKIRIGYLSADFHEHATAYLMAGIFERHDRDAFEIVAISFGPKFTDGMRARLHNAFEHFVEIGDLDDIQASARIGELAIDILVDLKGFTRGARTGILSRRPAPIQISYLGYPGTMGADYIDYLVADHTLIPPEARCNYTEKIAYLPNSYQANDSTRVRPENCPSRAEAGLPECGFVYCCFNNNYKITPDVFDVWMRLLSGVPGSVLWLLEDNAAAAANLRREAEARGITADRLVFATRIDVRGHLARHLLADLFLDTFNCNAHTTASDALWMGVPLLTRLGDTFHGRVAASLLHALEMPELVAHSTSEYESKALELAQDPMLLAATKRKLAEHRLAKPLFDTDSTVRHLESAYRAIWQRHCLGLPSDHIFIGP